MSRWPFALAVCLGLGLLAGSAAAQPKPKAASACGLRLLPLTVGNSWTFTAAKPPVEPPESMVRFIPVQPRLVTITVAGIETKDGKSVVTLDEDLDGRKVSTTITCGAGKFEASPDNFLFAGEPGGYFNLVFDKLDRRLIEGVPWIGAWREDIAATWKRVPSAGIEADLGSGTIEMERKFTLATQNDPLGTPYGTANPRYAYGKKLSVEVTGRVTIDGVEKPPQEMPANWINAIWFADGLGPLQILNSYYHLYVLSDAKIVK